MSGELLWFGPAPDAPDPTGTRSVGPFALRRLAGQCSRPYAGDLRPSTSEGPPINRQFREAAARSDAAHAATPRGSGGGGIRTHGPRERTPVFKTGAIDHSATPPRTDRSYAPGLSAM